MVMCQARNIRRCCGGASGVCGTRGWYRILYNLARTITTCSEIRVHAAIHRLLVYLCSAASASHLISVRLVSSTISRALSQLGPTTEEEAQCVMQIRVTERKEA